MPPGVPEESANCIRIISHRFGLFGSSLEIKSPCSLNKTSPKCTAIFRPRSTSAFSLPPIYMMLRLLLISVHSIVVEAPVQTNHYCLIKSVCLTLSGLRLHDMEMNGKRESRISMRMSMIMDQRSKAYQMEDTTPIVS